MATLPASRHRGVYWANRTGKWVAQVRVDGQSRYVGTFDDEDEAGRAVAAYWARQRTDWPARVVESLCDSKRHGFSFCAAWKIALRDNPPSGRDAASSSGTLFDVNGQPEEEPLVMSMERYCADAWHGRRPGLRHFSLNLLEPSDWSSTAERRGVIKQAA